MKIKTVPMEKRDVQKLTGDELEALVEFKKSGVYEIINKLTEESKTRRAFEALNANDLRDIAVLSGINIGLDLVIDITNRAKEELTSRGVEDNEVDSEDELK